jgi:transposase InsO family protein
MSDNGSCYTAHDYAAALHALGLRHHRIPLPPRTNGKAEQLNQTLLKEWADVRAYGDSPERAPALPRYLDRHYYRRPHGSLRHQPPAARLNNPVRNYNQPDGSTIYGGHLLAHSGDRDPHNGRTGFRG